MIIGTAGHVDHGKTSLVRALTHVDTDRLKEEKKRGISIDLGFAYLPVEMNGAESEVLGFVDVPGHEKFIHTMLAGASGIDFVLLVVAADDGIMQQTSEHLAIIDLLGIRHGLVAITKADLVSSQQISDLTIAIRNELAPTALANMPIIPVSTLSGAGIDQLQAMLVEAAQILGHRRTSGGFRLAVDRSFTINGVGTVVTGTVLSGKVAVGDHLSLSPSGKPVRVRSLHAQNRESEIGQAGDRCALNLAGEGISKSAIERGDMVLASGLHAPTNRIDASLRILPGERKSISQWFPVRLHHASNEVGARIVLLSDEAIEPGTASRVQLVLDAPIAAAIGDRFVIRDVSAQRTLGGGRFLDLRAPQRKRRSLERMAQLDAAEIEDPLEAARALLSVEPFHLDAAQFIRDRALAEAIHHLTDQLQAIALSFGQTTLWMLPKYWQLFRNALEQILASFHAENPDLAGMGVERLRLRLEPRLPAAAFRVALSRLIDEKLIVLDGVWIRLTGHEVSMDEADQLLWDRVALHLNGAGRFCPPRVRDLAQVLDEREEDVRRLLKLGGRMGRVHEVAHDHFFLRPTIAEMTGLLSELDESCENRWFIAAQFRDQIEIGRKVAIQILEFFDRSSVTIRRGDRRRLNRRRLDLFGDLTQTQT